MTKQEKSSKMAVLCHVCGSICTGEVLKVQEKHFHIKCFTCAECQESLASGGYFLKDNVYYCKKDYQKLFGIKCAECSDYVEGRVVTALGKMFHPHCFTCSRCKNPISTGAVLTASGTKILCHTCGAPNAKKGPPSATSPLAYLSEQKTSTQSPPQVTSPYPMSSSSNFSLTSSSSTDPTSPGVTQIAHSRYRPSPPPSVSTTSSQYSNSGVRKHTEQKFRADGSVPPSTTNTQRTSSPVFLASQSRTSSPALLLSTHQSSSPVPISTQRSSPSPHTPSTPPTTSRSMPFPTSPRQVSSPAVDLNKVAGSGSSRSLNRAGVGSSPVSSPSHQRSMSLDRGKNAADQMDGFVKTPPPSTKNDRGEKVKLGICAGCKEVIATNGTSILALKKHWHMWCLKCVGCSRVLSEEFVNNEGAPFCMSCYNQSHGTLCSGCQQYIRGRGLQAADQCFHPECAKCSRCGSGFEENDDMCILGGTLWHLKCDAELECALSASSSARSTPGPSPSTSTHPHSASKRSYTLPPSGSQTRSLPQRADTLPHKSTSSSIPMSTDPPSMPLPSVSTPTTSGALIPGRFIKKDTSSSVSERIKQFSAEKRREKGKTNGMSEESENAQNDQENEKDDYALIYSLQMLQFSVINNSKLPKGADRTKLECFLSDEDFAKAFEMSRSDFSKLPMWKQIELKKEAHLF